ncbi:MAG: c-type cytochrome [Saprospiraceae bacterium]|nr:c-type cytochrome [Saprospiraceae bacterium]
MKSLLVLTSYLLILSFCACIQKEKPDEPPKKYSDLTEEEKHLAENALLSFTTGNQLAVAQFASEPIMINPTNIDIDARGRVWLCEARNYRLQYNPNYEARPEGDRILILEDRDGNGRADTASVFYQGNDINAALGIAVFGNKVIVSASPNVLLLTDDDGDEVADRKDTLFTSIKGIDDDHGIHAFIFGPDGRFYFNFGNAGYQIRDKHGNPVKDIFGRTIEGNGEPYRQGMAFRCKPDGSELEVLGYNFRNIYELTVDSYGNIFQSDNDDDGNKGVRINYLIEYGNYGYQDQITGAGWRERRVGMNPEIPLRHWHQNDPGVIPNMLMTGAGSPAGITFYEGTLLPEVFHNQIIHAEPGHQVVRAYITKKIGAGYQATIENILQSEDKWFRPSDVCIAPDGSLFIADWHDAVVGGNGMDDIERGRIYRVTPIGQEYLYKVPEINLESLDGAAQALKSPNQATRYLAWNKLHDAGLEAEPALLQLMSEGNQVASIRALWLLAQLPQKGMDYVLKLLSSPSEDLRVSGIRMLRHLYPNHTLSQLSQMANDPSPQVRREVAVALVGQCSDDAVNIWLSLLDQLDPNDRWALEAIGLPADFCPDPFFDMWIKKVGSNWNSDVGKALIWRIHSPHALPYLEKIIMDPKTPRSALPKYFRSLHFIPGQEKNKILANILNISPSDTLILKAVLLSMDSKYLSDHRSVSKNIIDNLDLIKGSSEWFTAVNTLQLKDQADQLWSMIVDDGGSEKQKEASFTLLKLNGFSYLQRKLQSIDPDQYEKVITLFGNNANYEMANFLSRELSREDLDFTVKRRMVESLGNSGSGQKVLYEMINEGRLQEDLRLPAAVKLLNCWNSEIRNEAPGILASIPGSNFGKEPDLFSISRKSGDPEIGKKVFQAHCATCHQINGIGVRFGPDLSEIGDKMSSRGLYQAIIYPSAGVSYGYEGVNLTLHDGTIYQGYVESKTDEGIQLRTQSGQTIDIRNIDIKQREDLQKSLMTEGLFQTFSEEELIALVSYLETLKKSEAL